jgi:hypothetical protein
MPNPSRDVLFSAAEQLIEQSFIVGETQRWNSGTGGKDAPTSSN